MADYVLGVKWDDADSDAGAGAMGEKVQPAGTPNQDLPEPGNDVPATDDTTVTPPAKASPSPSPDPMGPDTDRYPTPVKLEWDFRTYFPLPTDEAIDKGWVDAKDTTPIGLVNLHSEYERELTIRLNDVAAAKEPEARQALERILGDLLDSYAEAFGVTQSHQFKIATDCRRRGETVELDLNYLGPGLPVDADKLLGNKPAGAPPPANENPVPTGPRVSHAPDEVMAAEMEMSPEEARHRHHAHN
ncbi:MAG: hypothetical protein AAF916_10995 [Planctomycetota bacterium]